MSDSNLEAAIKAVADSTDLSVRPIEKEDEGPTNTSVLIRTTDEVRERWRQAAIVDGKTMSAWIRDVLNAKAKTLLECEHPSVRRYPWSVTCLKCGQRLQ